MTTLTEERDGNLAEGGRAWAPWVSRIVMGPPVGILTLITLRFFTDPAHAVPGIAMGTPESYTDMRVEGALSLTLLLMLILCIAARSRLWLGHVLLISLMGFALVTRIYGFMNDGTTLQMGAQQRITIAEGVFLVLNIVGLTLQTSLRVRRVVP